MKILILSDIHANWYALEAILDRENYHALIFLGDAVDFGPSPRNCIKFLMKSSKGRFRGVRGGDHDHALAYGINSKCPGELSVISAITREWGEGFLSSEEVGFLRRLPLDNEFSMDGINFDLIHGSEVHGSEAHGSDLDSRLFCKCKAERGLYNHYSSDEIDEEEERNFILVGHSHKPFIKT